MEFAGRYVIPAPPETVWDAINDPEILKGCIPGCQSMAKTDDTHFEASVKIKIGPVSATFKGRVALEELDPPHRCVLTGEGQGGVAGFAKGSAEVLLTPEGDGTALAYNAKANVGGKLAQIGQRLVDGAARQLADEFFAKFAAAVGDDEAARTAAGKGAGLGAEAVTLAQSGASGVPTETIAAGAPPDATIRGRDGSTGRLQRGGLAPEIWVVGLIGVIVILLILFGVVL